MNKEQLKAMTLTMNIQLGAERLSTEEEGEKQGTLMVILRCCLHLIDPSVVKSLMKAEDHKSDHGHLLMNMGARDWHEHCKKWEKQRPFLETLLRLRELGLELSNQLGDKPPEPDAAAEGENDRET